jgi:hypothetical protein
MSQTCQHATLTEGASTAECWLLGAGLYAVVVRVSKIGLAVCPLLAGFFANRLTPVGTIFLGAEKEPLYSALRCSGSFFGARARVDDQKSQNQDHRPIHMPFQPRRWITSRLRFSLRNKPLLLIFSSPAPGFALLNLRLQFFLCRLEHFWLVRCPIVSIGKPNKRHKQADR